MGVNAVTTGNPTLSIPKADIAQFEQILQSVMEKEKDKQTLALKAEDLLKQFGGKVDAKQLASALGIGEDEAKTFIAEADEDGDPTTLTQAELTDALQWMQDQSGQGTPANHGGDPSGGASGAQGADGSQSAGGSGALSQLAQLLVKLLDQNGDGEISSKDIKQLLKKYGKDHGDGQKSLSKDELKNALKAEAKEKGIDLSDDQLNSMVNSLFKTADANGDGLLNEAELTSAAGKIDQGQLSGEE